MVCRARPSDGLSPSLLKEVRLSSLMEIAPMNCKFIRGSQGVPQRSVLGSILFLLYINDLPDSLKSQVRLFADDTAVYITVQGQNDNAKLQRDLDLLQKWEQEWDIEFYNPSRCQVVHITMSRRSINTSYCMHGQLCPFYRNVATFLGFCPFAVRHCGILSMIDTQTVIYIET